MTLYISLLKCLVLQAFYSSFIYSLIAIYLRWEKGTICQIIREIYIWLVFALWNILGVISVLLNTPCLFTTFFIGFLLFNLFLLTELFTIWYRYRHVLHYPLIYWAALGINFFELIVFILYIKDYSATATTTSGCTLSG